MKNLLKNFTFLLLMALPFITEAHQPNQSFIYLRIYETDGIEGRFEFHERELIQYFGVELENKYLKADAVRAKLPEIKKYILEHASFRSVYGDHKIVFTDSISMLRVVEGSFARFHFKLENISELPDEIEVFFNAFYENDPTHSGMLGIEYNWKAGLIDNESLLALYFTQGNSTQALSLTDRSIWQGFKAMIDQGMWHIWIGLDHILFLVALILPSVVRRRRIDPEEGESTEKVKYRWVPVKKFRPAFIYIIKVITFFTIAHTITLSLASLNIVDLPSRLVESVIALSIGLAAYNNINPIFKGKDWIIAFVFGLFHGFGFASVLADLGVKGEFLTLTLLGFNLGVEIGQVLIIAMIFPVLYLIRNHKYYSKFLLYMSVLLIVISLYWFVERSFDIDMVLDEKIRRAGGDVLRWLGLR